MGEREREGREREREREITLSNLYVFLVVFFLFFLGLRQKLAPYPSLDRDGDKMSPMCHSLPLLLACSRSPSALTGCLGLVILQLSESLPRRTSGLMQKIDTKGRFQVIICCTFSITSFNMSLSPELPSSSS